MLCKLVKLNCGPAVENEERIYSLDIMNHLGDRLRVDGHKHLMPCVPASSSRMNYAGSHCNAHILAQGCNSDTEISRFNGLLHHIYWKIRRLLLQRGKNTFEKDFRNRVFLRFIVFVPCTTLRSPPKNYCQAFRTSGNKSVWQTFCHSIRI